MDEFVVEIKISDNNLSYKSDFTEDGWWWCFMEFNKTIMINYQLN
jgi:hypothetical protein